MKIDFQQDKISIFGKTADINFTSTGHYCIKLDNMFNDGNACKSNMAFFCKKYM